MELDLFDAWAAHHNFAVSSGEPIIESEPQFAYAACTNCGYSIFFDTDYLPKTRRAKTDEQIDGD